MKKNNYKDKLQITTLILCGGLGIRLRKVINDRQKCMAEINERPFLDFLIDYLSGYGIKKVIFCIGYMADTVKQYYKDRLKIKVLFSEEIFPLGTAGAIKNAENLIESNPFLVMNGDSICKIDLRDFFISHIRKNAQASIALTNTKNTNHKGLVKLDGSGKILGFYEKIEKDTKLKNNYFVNAGIYIFDKKILSKIPKDRKYSLEYNLFPNLDRCYGYLTNEKLVDIGTPRGFKEALRTHLFIENQQK